MTQYRVMTFIISRVILQALIRIPFIDNGSHSSLFNPTNSGRTGYLEAYLVLIMLSRQLDILICQSCGYFTKDPLTAFNLGGIEAD